MKNSKIIFLTTLLGLLFLTFSPQEATAQSRKENKKHQTNTPPKTKKVAVRNHKAPVQPKRGVVRNQRVTHVAPRAHIVHHGLIDYRYNDGIFYRPQGNAFVITRPPIGIRVTILPPRYTRVYVGSHQIYYDDGVYYNPVGNGNYEVIQPPIGARIEQIPPYSELTYLDGREYYISEGTYYKVVQEYDGRLAYEVVGYI